MRFAIPGKLDGLNEYTNANRSNPLAGASIKKRNEKAVAGALMAYGIKEHFSEPVYLRFCWVEPNKRRDKDNICSAKKFILDALVKAGVLEGDGWKHIIGFSDRFSVDKQNPRVEVEILTQSEVDKRRGDFIESLKEDTGSGSELKPEKEL